MQQFAFNAETFPYLHPKGRGARNLSHVRGLATNIAEVNRDALHNEYSRLKKIAPRRANSGKSHFSDTRNGKLSRKRASNRHEEHLAMALWNLKNRWSRDEGNQFCLLDYQFPLKAKQSDPHIGKVDLLGVTDQGRLMIIELKVENSKNNGRGDNPTVALLEGLRYTAIVQANQKAIADEVERRFEVKVTEGPPIVQILAPEDWWCGWMQLGKSPRPAGDWASEYEEFARDIEEQIGVAIECAALDVKPCQVSISDEKRPKLDRAPELMFLIPGVG